jgi:hypothetical protein
MTTFVEETRALQATGVFLRDLKSRDLAYEGMNRQIDPVLRHHPIVSESQPPHWGSRPLA